LIIDNVQFIDTGGFEATVSIGW